MFVIKTEVSLEMVIEPYFTALIHKLVFIVVK